MATNSAINTATPIEVAKGGIGAASLTDHGALIGSGTGAITAAAVGTNGQILLGATGADSAFATLTSTGGTISFTTGAGTLNLEASGGGYEWSEVTGTSQAMSNGAAYIANNAGQVTLTLPATAAVGTSISIVGKGAGGYKIAQNASQFISVDDEDTGAGASYYLESDGQYDCIELMCSATNTHWVARNIIGSFTAGGGGTEPTTWTNRTSSFGSSNIIGVQYGADGYWVATGASAAKAATATDPTSTWTQRTTGASSTVTSPYYDGSSYWVIVSEGGELYTAPDPTSTWTSRTSSFSGTAIFGVHYGSDGKWVATGGSGKIATATDPTGTWTQRTSQFGSDQVNKPWYDGSSLWCIVGASGDLSTATDPTSTWTSRTSGFSGTTIFEVVYDGTNWITCGGSQKIFYASDPTGAWTQNTNESFDANHNDLESLGTNGAGISVICGNYYTNTPQIGTTSSASGTWTDRSNSLSNNVYSVAEGDGDWVTVGLSGGMATGA